MGGCFFFRCLFQEFSYIARYVGAHEGVLSAPTGTKEKCSNLIKQQCWQQKNSRFQEPYPVATATYQKWNLSKTCRAYVDSNNSNDTSDLRWQTRRGRHFNDYFARTRFKHFWHTGYRLHAERSYRQICHTIIITQIFAVQQSKYSHFMCRQKNKK